MNIVLLHQAFDGGQLVLGIQNLEGLRQPRQLPMRAQQAIAQAVESAYPHTARAALQHIAQTLQHFFGGFIGKSHRQNLAGPALLGLQQPSDARGQHPGFA